VIQRNRPTEKHMTNTDLKYPRILRYVATTPWAMEPTRFADVLDVLRFKAHGGQLTQEEIREYCGLSAASQELAVVRGNARQSGVAIVPVRGIIAHHAGQVDDVSGPGGTSIEGFRNRFRAAMASNDVGSVVLDIDSPGGAVEGVEEMGDEIRNSRGGKPIVAVANGMAASAAFWLASAADEVSVTPSGQVGSVGVFAAHEDISAALEEQGIKMTLVHAGKFKVEGNPFEPLGDEAREHLQGRVDASFRKFVGAIAAGRNTDEKNVRENFGQGRLVDSESALSAGMVDRIETLESAVNRMRALPVPGAARAQVNMRRYGLAFK
jgi:signal peptide peptidase SppA